MIFRKSGLWYATSDALHRQYRLTDGGEGIAQRCACSLPRLSLAPPELRVNGSYACRLLACCLTGAWSNLRDDDDINTVSRSRNTSHLATGDNHGHVSLYRYPCTAERVSRLAYTYTSLYPNPIFQPSSGPCLSHFSLMPTFLSALHSYVLLPFDLPTPYSRLWRLG